MNLGTKIRVKNLIKIFELTENEAIEIDFILTKKVKEKFEEIIELSKVYSPELKAKFILAALFYIRDNALGGIEVIVANAEAMNNG